MVWGLVFVAMCGKEPRASARGSSEVCHVVGMVFMSVDAPWCVCLIGHADMAASHLSLVIGIQYGVCRKREVTSGVSRSLFLSPLSLSVFLSVVVSLRAPLLRFPVLLPSVSASRVLCVVCCSSLPWFQTVRGSACAHILPWYAAEDRVDNLDVAAFGQGNCVFSLRCSSSS